MTTLHMTFVLGAALLATAVGRGAIHGRPCLTDFLSSRLAEREQAARQLIADCEQRDLVVDTCAAHRRLLDLYRYAQPGPVRDGYLTALRLIAEAYRGHPEYDDAWTVRQL